MINCSDTQKIVIEEVLNVIDEEVEKLCGKKEPSILRTPQPTELKYLDLKTISEELKKRTPTFYRFCAKICTSQYTRAEYFRGNVNIKMSKIVCPAVMMLKARNREMNAWALKNSLALLYGKCSNMALIRLASQHVSIGPKTVRAVKIKLGKSHGQKLIKMKKAAEKALSQGKEHPEEHITEATEPANVGPAEAVETPDLMPHDEPQATSNAPIDNQSSPDQVDISLLDNLQTINDKEDVSVPDLRNNYKMAR